MRDANNIYVVNIYIILCHTAVSMTKNNHGVADN